MKTPFKIFTLPSFLFTKGDKRGSSLFKLLSVGKRFRSVYFFLSVHTKETEPNLVANQPQTVSIETDNKEKAESSQCSRGIEDAANIDLFLWIRYLEEH